MYFYHEIVPDSFQLEEVDATVFEVGYTRVDRVENWNVVCVVVNTEQMHRLTIVLGRMS